MPYVPPSTATAGSVLTAAFLNTNYRDNLNDHETRFKQYAFQSQNSMNPTNFASTTFSGSAEVFGTDATWTADGTSTYVVDVYIPLIHNPGASTLQCTVWLSDGSTGQVALLGLPIMVAGMGIPFYGRHFYTPAAGSRSVNVRISVTTLSVNVYGHTAGTSYTPASLRVMGPA